MPCEHCTAIELFWCSNEQTGLEIWCWLCIKNDMHTQTNMVSYFYAWRKLIGPNLPSIIPILTPTVIQPWATNARNLHSLGKRNFPNSIRNLGKFGWKCEGMQSLTTSCKTPNLIFFHGPMHLASPKYKSQTSSQILSHRWNKLWRIPQQQ